MVNTWTGEWMEENDYSSYPKEKWCLMDYMADLIRNKLHYVPREITMEQLILRILTAYQDENAKAKAYSDLLISVWRAETNEAIQTFITETNELEEFDYEG